MIKELVAFRSATVKHAVASIKVAWVIFRTNI
jgi:hypothetical protein